MNIKSRLNRLESMSDPAKAEAKVWVLLYEEPEPQGIRPDDTVVRVSCPETRELVLRIIAGEGT